MTGLRLSEERRKRVAGAEKKHQYHDNDASKEKECRVE